MAKLIAILNVVAWSGFWAFGFLALTADPGAPGSMTAALMLAAIGGALGLWAWLWLMRRTAPPAPTPQDTNAHNTKAAG